MYKSISWIEYHKRICQNHKLLQGAQINSNFKFKDESNQTYSSNQFVNRQVSLIKNWFCGCSYYIQSLSVCIHGWNEISTPMSAGINTAPHKPMLYILCLSATWLLACSLLKPSHRSTWSPLTSFLSNSSFQKAANGTLSQRKDSF